MFVFTDTNPYSDGAHIAFLLDGSAAVSWFEYRIQKEFVMRVMLELETYSTQFNAAVVEYSDEATLLINFTQRFDLHLFLNRLITLPENSGGWPQRIDKALTFTSKYVFTSTGQDIPKIAILFAYSEYLPPGFHSKASESLRQKGVRIFVVEMNNINPREELLSITEREDDLIRTSFFEMYDDFDSMELVTKVLLAIGKY